MLLVRVHQLIYSWSDKNISTWQISTSGVCSYSKYEPWIKFRGSDILIITIIFVFVRLVHISCYMPPGKQTKDNMPVVHPTFSGNSSLLLGGSGATPVQHFSHCFHTWCSSKKLFGVSLVGSGAFCAALNCTILYS